MFRRGLRVILVVSVDAKSFCLEVVKAFGVGWLVQILGCFTLLPGSRSSTDLFAFRRFHLQQMNHSKFDQASVLEAFTSALSLNDLSFIELLESSAFQKAASLDKSFFRALPVELRWKLLFGIWNTLLDYSFSGVCKWDPDQQMIPFLPVADRVSLEQFLQALCCADFCVSRISWSEEFSRDISAVEERACDSAFRSVAAAEFVDSQIEVGLSLCLACDFTAESMTSDSPKRGLIRRGLAWVTSAFLDKTPSVS